MPGTVELFVAGLIAVVYPVWDYFMGWPRMSKAISSGRPGARVSVYREVIALQWIIVAVICVGWIHAARPWATMGLNAPSGWRLGLAVVLVSALSLLLPAQLRTIRRLDPAKLARVRARVAQQSPLIPRNRVERVWFALLSLTAGLCEELIYRGFLVWCFRPWLGLWGAALASTVSFGFAHAYQGQRGALRAAAFGALFALLAIAMGSIVPGMILHALLDLISGESSFALFADDSAEGLSRA